MAMDATEQQRPIDVLVIGDLNPDLILSGGSVVPRFGQAETLVDNGVFTLGGSAAITACGLAKLGLRTSLVAVVGQDPLGRLMVDQLVDAGVGAEHVTVDASLATGISVHLVAEEDRAIVTHLGSIAALQSSDIDMEWFHTARHVHVAGVFLLTGLRAELAGILRKARLAGCTVSIDTNWDPSEQWEISDLLEVCDVLLPNEVEAAGIAGALARDAAVDPGMALSTLVETVVVKQGKAGARLVRGSYYVSETANAVEAVDAIGAGDSFNAGYLAGRLNGDSTVDALRLGLASGSLSVRSAGGTDSQPSLAEARRFMNESRE